MVVEGKLPLTNITREQNGLCIRLGVRVLDGDLQEFTSFAQSRPPIPPSWLRHTAFGNGLSISTYVQD